MPKNEQYDLGILRAIPIRQVINHETGKDFVRKGVTEFTQCPMHEDRGPSLSINEEDNTWYCHGACGVGGDSIRFIERLKSFDFQEACKYLTDTHEQSALIEDDGKARDGNKGTGRGRKPMPMMPIPEAALTEALPNTLKGDWWEKKMGTPRAHWRYHDANGGVAYIDVRFEYDKGGETKKQVVPLYFGKNGRWKMGIPFEILKRPRILYNLHLLAGTPDKPVLVVEGCKCASVNYDGLRDRFILTTWPGGTNAIPKVDIRPLYNRKVIIWPDGDSPNQQWERGGYKAAFYLAEKLSEKADVTILRASEHPKGKETKHGYDIADYIEDGGDPVAYVSAEKNVITLDTCRELAGLRLPEAEDMPDFRDVKKFSTLAEPSNDVLLNVTENLTRNPATGAIARNDGNFLYIIENDPAFRYLAAYDTATNLLQHSDKYKELDEIDNALWQYCQRFYNIAPSKTQRTDLVKSIAYRNSYNSLEIYFDELKGELFADNPVKFDENPLLEILGHMRFSLEDEYTDPAEIRKYYTELFHKFFLRMFVKLEYIMRGDMDHMPPSDMVPILEGDQGIGKTRFCLFLSIHPQKYYVDMADLQLTTSRDTLAKIRGKLIAELGELAGLKRTEIENIKAFISAPFDSIRRLYSESLVQSPRTISFIGTTNEREYLRDTTGNRRFWPVRLDYVNQELYSKVNLVKMLYVYYRQLAKKSIAGDTVQADLLVSPGLGEFMQYLRDEKRVKPAFLDEILHYIIEMESKPSILPHEPVRININMAAEAIFQTPENKMPTLPPRFQPEFNRVLVERGYKQARGPLGGKFRRYWQLDGRYCSRCKRVVDNVTEHTIDEIPQRICDECIDSVKNEAPEPF
jgi:hypothetical protein